MQKKVLFTSHLANFKKFNIQFMKWFQEQGWQVDYASLDEEPIPYCNHHFKVCINRSPYSLDNIRAYRQLKAIIDSGNYDIIHCHTPMCSVITRLAARKARKNGTKVIYTAHGFHFYKGAPKINWMFYYTVEKMLSKYTDCLITMNGEDYQTAVQKHFKAGQIQKTDGVGVDLNRFRPAAAEEKHHLRLEYGFSDQDFLLIYVAEFTKNKNQAFILHALQDINQSISNCKIIFAGRGNQLEECKRLAKEYRMDNTVSFMGYRSDVEKLYRLSDILVSASHREGLPVNILEGMASALPVVCTKVRGQVDLIQDSRNGFLYSINDTETFIYAIERLYQDEKLRQQIIKNNLEDVQAYSVEKAVSQMAQIYKQYME